MMFGIELTDFVCSCSSPQFSPAFSEPPHSPWVSQQTSDGDGSGAGAGAAPEGQSGPSQSANVRDSLREEQDEALGDQATMCRVLYANLKHPEWKKEYPGKSHLHADNLNFNGRNCVSGITSKSLIAMLI